MRTAQAHRRWIIALTLFAGLALAVWPLPHFLDSLWPAWLALILVYWGMALPQRVSVGIAWFSGLRLDVLQGALLGEHALALAVLVYIARKWHLRFRLFPMHQQMLAMTIMLLAYHFILYWIRGIAGTDLPLHFALLPVLSGAFAWPLVYVILRNIRRRYQVS